MVSSLAADLGEPSTIVFGLSLFLVIQDLGFGGGGKYQ